MTIRVRLFSKNKKYGLCIFGSLEALARLVLCPIAISLVAVTMRCQSFAVFAMSINGNHSFASRHIFQWQGRMNSSNYIARKWTLSRL